MSNIPEDIKQKIEARAVQESSSPSDYDYLKKYYAFGYSLAISKIEKLEKKVEEQVILIDQWKREYEALNNSHQEQAKEIEFLKKCISDLNYFIA